MDFSTLYRQHAPSVRRFVRTLTRNPAEVDDLVAETFARAWAGADRLRQETVRAYLLTIARHLVWETARKRRRFEPLDPELTDSGKGPEHRALARSEWTQVEGWLEELPPLDRAALLLRGVEGLSYRQIAAALSLSLSATKVKIYRARLKLAQKREERP